jgi:hypothetical protein
VNNAARHPKITVSAGGQGLMSQAGMLLLAEALRVTGLCQGLAGGLARWWAPRAVHDPGKIVTDLVVALALGGECLAAIPVLHAQPELAGPVASGPVVSWLFSALAADLPKALRAIRKARALPVSAPGRWPVLSGTAWQDRGHLPQSSRPVVTCRALACHLPA